MKISKKVSIARERLKTHQSKSRLLMPNRLVRRALNDLILTNKMACVKRKFIKSDVIV